MHLFIVSRVTRHENNSIRSWCVTPVSLTSTFTSRKRMQQLFFFFGRGGWGFKGSGFNFVWRKNDLCPVSWICSPPNSALMITVLCLRPNAKFLRLLCKRRMPGINQVCTHDRQKPKFAGNLWNALDVSTEFPASASVDSLFTVCRSMKLGPSLYTLIFWCFFW